MVLLKNLPVENDKRLAPQYLLTILGQILDCVKNENDITPEINLVISCLESWTNHADGPMTDIRFYEVYFVPTDKQLLMKK